LRRFREEFGGLDPEYFADMLALMGDASDNVPGVKGLGPKTALPLLLQFGTVEALLDRVDEVCPSLACHSPSNRSCVAQQEREA